jgi:lysozyme
MKTSAAGRKALTQREGIRLTAYLDSVGVWTIGVGHAATSGVEPIPHKGMRITAQQADDLLSADLARYEAAVNTSVKVPLTQNQFDACVSLCFNIGQRGFMHSTVVARLNRRDYRGAADAFLMWQHPAVLRSRRDAERKQFLTGAAL